MANEFKVKHGLVVNGPIELKNATNQSISGSISINGSSKLEVSTGIYSLGAITSSGAKIGNGTGYVSSSAGVYLTKAGSAVMDDLGAYRTITIKGTTNQVYVGTTAQNLSANRTWTIGLQDNVKITNNLTIGDNVASDVFSSGFGGSGFAISQSDGRYIAQFDDLWVRGSMNVYQMVINQIRATNGSLWISDASKAISASYDSTNKRIVLKFQTGSLIPFIAGDILRSKRWGVSGSTTQSVWDITTTVSAVNYATGYVTISAPSANNSYTVTGSANGTWAQFVSKISNSGSQWVRVGNINNSDRKGSIYITSNDIGGPFIDVYDGVSSSVQATSGASQSVTSTKVKVRIGKLKGIVDPTFTPSALSGYGLYSDNVYLTGTISAKAGDIAGWNLNDTSIYKEFSNNKFSMTNSVDGAGLFVYSGQNPVWNDNSTKVYLGSDGKFSLGNKLTFNNGVLSISGIEADVGELGGWSVGASTIYANGITLSSATPSIQIGATGYGTDGIWLGKGNKWSASMWNGTTARGLKWNGDSLLISASNFSLDTNGKISANDAVISGSIKASAGTIGGWTIDSSALTAEYQYWKVYIGPTQISFRNSDYGDSLLFGTNSGYFNGSGIGYFINNNPLTPYFKVDRDGAFLSGTINASAGLIGGWSIEGSALTAADQDSNVYIGPKKIQFDKYNDEYLLFGTNNSFLNGSGIGYFIEGNPSTPSFKVDKDGAFLSGSITASAGLIGGWTINETNLSSNGIALQAGTTPAIKIGKASAFDTGTGIFMSGSSNTSYLRVGQIKGTGKKYLLWDGTNLSWQTPNFTMSTAGTMTITGSVKATSGQFVGSVTANAGFIGGWKIANNRLQSNNNKMFITASDTYPSIRIGTSSLPTSFTGMTANYMYLGLKDVPTLQLVTDDDNYFKWTNSELYINSPKLTLSPTALNISGSITTSAGLIGGWDINNSGISQSGVAITKNAMTPTQGLLDAYGNFSYSAANAPYFTPIINRYSGSPTLYSSTVAFVGSSSVTSLSGGAKLGVTVDKQTWNHLEGGKSLFHHINEVPAGKYTIEFSNSITGVSNTENFAIYDIWVQVFQGTAVPNQIEFLDSSESRIYCGHDSPLFSLNQNPNQVKQFSIDVKQAGLTIVIKSQLILPADNASVNAATFTYSGFRIDQHNSYTELSKNGLLLYGSPTNITKLSNSDQNSYLKVKSVDSIAINANVMTVGTINASNINAPKQNVYYINPSGNSVTLSSHHVNGYVKINKTSGVTCSIDKTLTTNCRVGDVISICQEGNGIVHVTSISPVNIRSYNSWKKTYGQYSVVQLVYVGGYNWDLIGASN